jgi:Tol biopolymer transport system component
MLPALAAFSPLFTPSVDGKQWINLTQNPADVYPTAWSPTGHFIAFSSNRPGSELSTFFVMNSYGTAVSNIGHNTLSRPAWLPVGHP